MKLLNKFLILFSTLSITLEAKQVEIVLDHTIQTSVNFESKVDYRSFDQPKYNFFENCHVNYLKQIQIENCGNEILYNCLFSTDKPAFYTLKQLNSVLFSADQPLQTLFKIWHQSVALETKNSFNTPLDILNFEGACTAVDYTKHFLKLCHQLGVSIRPVNKKCHPLEKSYDFCYQNYYWLNFCPLSYKSYLALNNQMLVSSENLLDDPLLVLRSKLSRFEEFDFKANWSNLAQFEIINARLPDELHESIEFPIEEMTGYDLYPTEKFIYNCETNHPLSCHQCLTEHQLDAAARANEGTLSYTSLFPIYEIYNNTDADLTIDTSNAILRPGDRLAFSSKQTFTVSFTFKNTVTKGYIHLFGICSKEIVPDLMKGTNQINLGTQDNKTTIKVKYEFDDEIEEIYKKTIKVVNSESVFDYCIPYFEIESHTPQNSIWWQISSKEDFSMVPSNFDHVESYQNHITLPLITDTFFNDGDDYYFRVKGCVDGIWSDWSDVYHFKVRKPDPVQEIEFEKIKDHAYEIKWEKSDEPIEYYIFGSNALDFIPSIYCSYQINGIVNGEIVDQESCDNLQVITKENKIVVDGSLAYYRIIAKENGAFSTPSRLIHVYDCDLIQHRTVLQVVEETGEKVIVKRVEIPLSDYSTEHSSDLLITNFEATNWENKLIPFASFSQLESPLQFAITNKSRHISNEIWEIVKPYLIPENHPIKGKLDRMFSAKRITQDPKTWKYSGFKRDHVGKFSRIMASTHPDILGYYVKAFPDTELKVVDWKKLIHRIRGANAIRRYINENGYSEKFSVPRKWLYQLPEEPSPPNNGKYLRKNFVLIAEDMRIYEYEKNERMYKKNMSEERLNILFRIMQDVGLYDSVYAFNVPFTKNGKQAFIDTEHHHSWPVPFHKMTGFFCKKRRKQWEALIKSTQQ